MCPFLAQHGALFNPAKLGSLLKQQLEIMASLREEAGKLPCQEGGEALEQAIESTYIDKKCTFTGNVSSRGHILLGKEKSHVFAAESLETSTAGFCLKSLGFNLGNCVCVAVASCSTLLKGFRNTLAGDRWCRDVGSHVVGAACISACFLSPFTSFFLPPRAERACQKQPTTFQNKKHVLLKWARRLSPATTTASTWASKPTKEATDKNALSLVMGLFVVASCQVRLRR
ncbi:uncharacterized protein LOC102367827 isoform X1 [Alligator sinensis]|uniref:Uncharacterized protein LOC102367827 isoform X1 n=1 Tax=Alligator sinensis TaxID=38654 RepID=A0A3Q0FNI7_ALLSI|nr:uncharacterized protein LOC102367827 isoform X1 [Alligator sinensis]